MASLHTVQDKCEGLLLDFNVVTSHRRTLEIVWIKLFNAEFTKFSLKPPGKRFEKKLNDSEKKVI